MKPDVFIPWLILLIWGLLIFSLKSKGNKNKPWLWLEFDQQFYGRIPVIQFMSLWILDCLSLMGTQLLWMPTVVFIYPSWYSGHFSDRQHSLPVGCFSEGMQPPTSTTKYLCDKEPVWLRKMFTDFSLLLGCILTFFSTLFSYGKESPCDRMAVGTSIPSSNW